MIKTKNSIISATETTMALRKLGASQLPTKVAYRVKRLLDAVNIELKKLQTDYKEIIGKEYAEMDDKGEWKLEQNPVGFKLKEGVNMDELNEKLKAFGEKEVTIDRWQLNLNDLGDTKISAAELQALDVFIADPEAEGNVTPIKAAAAQG